MSVKQVIVIRKDLGMRRGKEIAQGAHASMEWLRQRIINPSTPCGAHGPEVIIAQHEQQWLEGDRKKITLQVQTEAELRALADAATEAMVESWLITDLGATEFHGQPTVTALAIGPNLDERIDPLTRHLKLY